MAEDIIGGYKPVDMIPSRAHVEEVAGAARDLRESALNIVGAEKVQVGNEQMLRAATKNLEGLQTTPEVGFFARKIVEFTAADSSVRAWHEDVKAGVDTMLANSFDRVAGIVAGLNLDRWGRAVDIATQRASSREQSMDQMGATLGSQMPDARGLVPEKKGWLDRASDHFRKSKGKHERNADEMRTRAKDIEATKTSRPISGELSSSMDTLRAEARAQAARIAALEAYIQNQRAGAEASARTVGGTTLEQKVANVPFGK